MTQPSFTQQAEQNEFLRHRNNTNRTEHVFRTKGSAGNNSKKLAQIIALYDITMVALNWQDKPCGSFSGILVALQASIQGQYHRDYKAIAIADEIKENKKNDNRLP